VVRQRLGGNARKHKIQLTDATFDAMIQSSQHSESAVLEIVEETTILAIETSTAVFEGQDLVPAVLPMATIPLGRAPAVRRAPRIFSCQDYEFGYAACQTCRNDQAYYVHRQDLQAGYTFRCRVCRHEMTITKD
jgi:hypothetical protein